MPDIQKAIHCDHDCRVGLIDPLRDDRAANRWHTVTFDTPFPPGGSVIVLPMTQTYNGTETPGIRLRNVTPTSFEIRFDEVVGTEFSSDGNHINEQVGWMAFSLGTTATSFEGLGEWNVEGISGDGSVIVGSRRTTNGDFEAVYWTKNSGVVGLGHLPGGKRSTALGASADGSVIVGRSDTGTLDYQAFRWTQATGMIGLGTLPGATGSSANDVSADGSVIVGSSDLKPVKWDVASGIQPLSDPQFSGEANGVSNDGTVIVGRYETSNATAFFRWTQGCGFEGLEPREGFIRYANRISADGYVAVGCEAEPREEALLWSPTLCFVSLGSLEPNDPWSFANDVSGNGQVVVGHSRTDYGFRAFIWDEANGMRSLRDVLIAEHGLALTDWELDSASAISNDGKTIAGSGTGPAGAEAWIARIP